jgi:hypothetical protein
MQKYLKTHMKKIDGIISDETVSKATLEATIEDHLHQIGFMQHERFIHMLVTFFFGAMLFLLTVGFLAVQAEVLLILMGLFFLPILPYVWHYYFMENSVQQMYTQYNKLLEKQAKIPEKTESD